MKGMLDESIQTSLKVIELEPDFAVAHNNLGIAYLEKGERDLAVKHLDKAVELGYEVAPEILDEIKKYR
jgi:tetratricopeptide (TPR) repeat protein